MEIKTMKQRKQGQNQILYTKNIFFRTKSTKKGQQKRQYTEEKKEEEEEVIEEEEEGRKADSESK